MSTENAKSLTAYPKTRDEVSADRIARHITESAFARQHRLFRTDQTLALNEALASAYVAEYAVAALLRALAAVDPQRADEAARHVWEAWEDGGTCGEELWEWLTEYGIDPDSVEPYTLPPGADAKRAEALAEVDRLRAELAASEQQLSITKAYYIRRMDRRRELLDAARDELAALRAEWATAERAVISDDDGYTWLTCQCGRLLMQVTGGDTLAEMNRRTAGHDCPLTSTETAATPEQPAPDSGAPLDATTNA